MDYPDHVYDMENFDEALNRAGVPLSDSMEYWGYAKEGICTIFVRDKGISGRIRFSYSAEKNFFNPDIMLYRHGHPNTLSEQGAKELKQRENALIQKLEAKIEESGSVDMDYTAQATKDALDEMIEIYITNS